MVVRIVNYKKIFKISHKNQIIKFFNKMLKKLIENSKLYLDMLDGSEGSEEEIKCLEDHLKERFDMPIKDIYNIVIELNVTPILLNNKLLDSISFFNFKNSIEIFDSFILKAMQTGIEIKEEDVDEDLVGYINSVSCLLHKSDSRAECENDHKICLLKNFKNNESHISKLASFGLLKELKRAHENGCPWDEHTCLAAAENGHLNCLKYAHENGCPWNSWTCLKAAENGHLNCLKYAHENGCPWDKWSCTITVYNGHLDCLKYLHENGCPWDIWTCEIGRAHV
mgnify:FL=1